MCKNYTSRYKEVVVRVVRHIPINHHKWYKDKGILTTINSVKKDKGHYKVK